MKVVIIGGVAGGMTVARRLRRKDSSLDITIIDRSYHLAPSTCMLPYAITRDISDDRLHLSKIEEFEKRYNIKVKIMNEVIGLDEKNKELKVIETGSGSIFKLSYDKLIISTGTDAIRLKELDNLNDNIFIFKNLKNLQRLKTTLENGNYKNVAIVGAGVLGFELAENLHELGYNINIIDREKRVLSQFDSEIVKVLEEKVSDKVNIYANSTISSAKLVDNKIELNLGHAKILTDIVVVTVGNRPNSTFLENTSIKRDKAGYIYVDEYFQTNNPDIYALGDVVLTKEYITKEPMVFGTASVAQKQGRYVAENLIAEKSKKQDKIAYKGAVKTEIVKIFDYTLGRVGLNEREINEYYKINNKQVSLKNDIETIYIEEVANVPSFDKAKPIYMVGYFDKTTKKIIGAQAFGTESVDKRLDVIATAIKAEMTADDLVDLDLTYSPPFNIPRDIVNRLGSLAQKGDMK